MRHDWIEPPNLTMAERLGPPKRVCRNCGARQSKEPKTWYMRVVGYQWWPLVGRCKSSPASSGEVGLPTTPLIPNQTWKAEQ